MSRSLHLSHKLLLLGVLLAAFCLPFIAQHVHGGISPSSVRAGIGILQQPAPAPHASSDNNAASLNSFAGASLPAAASDH